MPLAYRVIDIGSEFNTLMDQSKVRLEIPYLAPNPAETVSRNQVTMGSFETLCGFLLQRSQYSRRDKGMSNQGSDAANTLRPGVRSQVICHERVEFAVYREFW
jgi:hypothetical protein